MADPQGSSKRRSGALALGLKFGIAILAIAVLLVLPPELRQKLDRWYTAWQVLAWVGIGVLVLAIGLSGLIHGESDDRGSQR